jgi:DNA-binding PadR family transcriptional regulator
MARIAVFKGRDARLNKAIFWILAQQSPLTIYDIWRKLRAQRNFTYIPYNTVNRRVRALEKQGYVEKDGERRTKTGFLVLLYQLTARAYLAVLLDGTNLEDFIEKASETRVLTALAALTPT